MEQSRERQSKEQAEVGLERLLNFVAERVVRDALADGVRRKSPGETRTQGDLP